MDETISSIIQIGELSFRIGKGITQAMIKAFQHAYYAQWHGQASFQKLHNLCGSHISYLEIGTENAEVLRSVKEKIFDKYKILYSDLPDLRVDGKTQFAFNADQTEALKAGINIYNAERLEKLEETKQNYGVWSEKYQQAKKQIAEQYPEIRSVTAEDYALTRFQDDGNTLTEEYKQLEKSAQEEMHKMNLPKPETPLEERTIQFAEAKKKVDYEALIKEGKAQRLSVAECQTEYVPIGGKDVPFFHAKISDTESVVLPPTALSSDRKSVLLMYDKRYPIVSTKSAQIVRRTGKQVSEQIAKRTAKAAQKTVKVAAKTAAKTAAKSNPYTAAVQKAIKTVNIPKKIGLISYGKKR